MVAPVAFSKVASKRPPLTRVLSANVLLVTGLGLLVTFTRAAWIGAVVGTLVVVALRRGHFHPRPLLVAGGALVIGLAIVLIGGSAALSRSGGQNSMLGALYSRIVSIPDVSSGTVAQRISVWRDTLPLISSRPITGYGPDTFGLVYPSFQSVNRNGILWDKAHEDLLQVGATQGILGMLATCGSWLRSWEPFGVAATCMELWHFSVAGSPIRLPTR